MNVPDSQAAALIRADRIDILVDLSLHMAGNRLLLFNHKPAPIQVTYLGYCSTTGLDTVAFRFSDPHLDPPESDLTCYSETTIRLPVSYWCYQPGGAAPAVTAAPALYGGGVSFGCLNSFSKVSPQALRLWSEILIQTPGSKILLHCSAGSHRQRVIDQFAATGVTADRVDFAGLQSWQQYMESYQRIDIAMDPFPYGGGITTCDALWMGVPVVTLTGQTAVGRGGRSILSQIGMTDFITFAPADYVRKACDTASNPNAVNELRTTLRNRMVLSPLMDAKRFAGDIQAAFRKIWTSWLS
jgi:predicted O-linked N-acetylglucosamine transferase (SPINDLY family)